MSTVIRIGTRDSELALWQAKTVQKKLEALEVDTVLIPIKSQGDIVLDQPLYELGITGIFTKTLDLAMINGQIDIAVHSLKDVPTALPKGIVQAAVLKRASATDVLLHKGLDFLETEGIVATGSLRRKAQWLHRYPKHTITNLRGNVNTRLQKLKEHTWHGAVFAAAGLQRIALLPKDALTLDWMIPAPAQGAMMIAAMEKDSATQQILSKLNHYETQVCVEIEREFLKTLEGGCTAPIGALAQIINDEIHFKGALFSLDGGQKVLIDEKRKLADVKDFGKICAETILKQGGKEIMSSIKAVLG